MAKAPTKSEVYGNIATATDLSKKQIAGVFDPLAVEIGKAMGAKVIAAASSAEKLEVARKAGADELINYSEQSLKDEVKKLTGGQGVDN